MIIVSCNLKAQYTVVEIGSFGGLDTVPWRINSKGQVVGFDNVSGNWHAFLYSKAKLIDLHQSDSEYSLAWGINDQGVVVGEAHLLSSSEIRAFKFENGVITDLGVSKGYATAINNQGQVTGYSTSDGTRSFIYQSGNVTDIGSLGGVTTYASDINDNGQIVGSSDLSTGMRHAFLYGSGGMTDLGSFGSHSKAEAVNNLGQAV